MEPAEAHPRCWLPDAERDSHVAGVWDGPDDRCIVHAVPGLEDLDCVAGRPDRRRRGERWLERGSAALRGMRRGNCTFRGDTRADLDVGFFHHHKLLDGATACAAVLGGQHPLAVGLGQGIKRNRANTSVVIVALTRAEPDTPTGLYSLEPPSIGLACEKLTDRAL